jgi:integral membrane sensor domain MASE1
MPAPGTRSAGGYLLAVVALAAVYYGAAKLGLRLAYLDGAVTALWPPVGVGIAARTRFGPRLWPGVVVGDLLVANYSTPLGTVLGQTTGNTLEVLIAALLLRRLAGADVGLTRVVQVLALVVSAAVGTLVSACFGPSSLLLGTPSPLTSSPVGGGRGGYRISAARSWWRR